MFPYYWVHSEIKETCTRMQAFSSITMNNVDKEGQQESVTWGGEKKKKTNENNFKVCICVCAFAENIMIFRLRKDKAIIVKQNIHDGHANI